MESLINALKIISETNQKHDIPNEKTEKLYNQVKNPEFCVPIVGKFSSGKSALVNAILALQTDLLDENVGPETAIPTEVVYGAEERLIVYNRDGTNETFEASQYKRMRKNFDSEKVSHVRLVLENDVGKLAEFTDIILVDMPGFGSGVEAHNNAIDNYIYKSKAYIVAVSSDETVITDPDMISFLKELKKHQTEWCLVITKVDKKIDEDNNNPDANLWEEFEKNKTHLIEDLKKKTGADNIRCLSTSSKYGRINELVDYLKELQKMHKKISYEEFLPSVKECAENTKKILESRRDKDSLTLSEYEIEYKKITEEIEKLKKDIKEKKSNFEYKISDCAFKMREDIRVAFDGKTDTIIDTIFDGGNINNMIYTFARDTYMDSYQNRYLPLVQEYIGSVEKSIESMDFSRYDNGDYGYLNGKKEGILTTMAKTAIGGSVAASVLRTGATGALSVGGMGTLAAGMFTSLSAFMGPVAVLAAGALYLKKRRDAQRTREGIERKVRMELIPHVVDEWYKVIEEEITKEKVKITQAIEKEINDRIDALKNSAGKLKIKLYTENEEREKSELSINEDIEKAESLINELQ